MELLLPAIAALLYAVGAHLVKLSMGIGPWRVTFLSNFFMAVIYCPLLLVPAPPPGESAHFFQPAACGAMFFAGQIFTFAAIHKGDVSLVSPVMGLKVLLVTALTPLLAHESVPGPIWLAALLSMVAVALLGIGKPEDRNRVAITIFLTSVSALFYAATDVLVQKWTPAWGAQCFVPIMFTLNAALALTFIPFFSAPISKIPTQTWKTLAPGSTLLAVQALLMALALGVFGRAPALNVVYSSRGIWSILIVFAAARFLHEDEKALPRSTLATRLAGSLILLGAIALVVGE